MVIEPIIRRFLPVVVTLISLGSGLRASAHWETLLAYLNAEPFGVVDPLFGRDLGFFVFTLPFWRLLYGWSIALVGATLLLTFVLYVLQRSLVLTTRGPRLAAGARSHLLVLAAALLLLRAVGFWLDRFELVYSPRGIVFGATYTDIHASLPALGVLAVLAVVCAATCVLQIGRPRHAAGPRQPRGAGRWSGWAGSASIPRCSSGSGSPPTSWRRSGRSSPTTSA